MKITIEFDDSHYSGVKTSTTRAAETKSGNDYLADDAVEPINAGLANISGPEITGMVSNDDQTGKEVRSNFNETPVIDAGAFNAGELEGRGLIPQGHENMLATAVASGSALDGGGASFNKESTDQIVAPDETFLSNFDRTNAISAGEFMKPGN